MINVSPAILSKDNVVGVTLGFETKCWFVPDNHGLDTNVSIIEGEVNVFILKINNFTENNLNTQH
jgi:hypothetical protein